VHGREGRGQEGQAAALVRGSLGLHVLAEQLPRASGAEPPFLRTLRPRSKGSIFHRVIPNFMACSCAAPPALRMRTRAVALAPRSAARRNVALMPWLSTLTRLAAAARRRLHGRERHRRRVHLRPEVPGCARTGMRRKNAARHNCRSGVGCRTSRLISPPRRTRMRRRRAALRRGAADTRVARAAQHRQHTF
jgi:hypothetical protein